MPQPAQAALRQGRRASKEAVQVQTPAEAALKEAAFQGHSFDVIEEPPESSRPTFDVAGPASPSSASSRGRSRASGGTSPACGLYDSALSRASGGLYNSALSSPEQDGKGCPTAAAAPKDAPKVDQAAKAGDIDFLAETDSVPCSQEAGIASDSSATDSDPKPCSKEAGIGDESVNAFLMRNASEPRWMCKHCDTENGADRISCNNCTLGRCKDVKGCFESVRNGDMNADQQGEDSPSPRKDPPGFLSSVLGNFQQEASASIAEDTNSYWQCLRCDESNRAARGLCNNCGTCREQCPRKEPEVMQDKQKGERQKDENGGATTTKTLDERVSHWCCPFCEEENRASRTECHNCRRSKEDAVASNAATYKSSWHWTAREHPPASETEKAAPGNSEQNSWVKSAVDSDQNSCAKSAVSEPESGVTDSGVVHEEQTSASEEEASPSPQQVILHIYDVFADERVQAVNDVLHNIGTGAFHAGLEVFSLEWSYGCTNTGTGLVACEPKSNPAHRYRESIVMGTTPLSHAEVENLLQQMGEEWQGADYNLIHRNCCNFCDAFCRRLSVGPVPTWVTNLAGTGALLHNWGSAAALAVNELAVAAAERACELDKRYNILGRVDSFANQEISIDDAFLETKVANVQVLWTQSKQNLENMGRNIENAGTLAAIVMEEVKKSSDAKPVEAQLGSAVGQWWRGAQHTPYEALTQRGKREL